LVVAVVFRVMAFFLGAVIGATVFTLADDGDGSLLLALVLVPSVALTCSFLAGRLRQRSCCGPPRSAVRPSSSMPSHACCRRDPSCTIPARSTCSGWRRRPLYLTPARHCSVVKRPRRI